MATEMIVVETLSELREALQQTRSNSVGFVPTMGALHQGHASLVQRALRENETVVVSIFVNPTQFNDPKDLEKYPRTREADIQLLEACGAQILWFPRADEIYNDKYRYRVEENDLSLELCGRSRPGHFSGMLSVVLKLLQIVRPTRAYFGEKDHQQLELVRGLVQAFFVATDIIACPIARDSEGLALSSRNARLSSEGIRIARAFASELAHTQNSLETLRSKLSTLRLEIDYLEDRGARRYAAVVVEGVRLIDNQPLAEKETQP